MPAIPGGSRQQLATHDRDGLARERYTVAAYFHLDQTAAGGGLPRRERGPTETASPMGTEAAVRRSGHRILVDAGTRGEVARHEVDAVGLGFGRAPPSLCRAPNRYYTVAQRQILTTGEYTLKSPFSCLKSGTTSVCDLAKISTNRVKN